MATKKFIGTTYLGGKGGSGGSYNTGTSLLHNGMVSYNATSQGAPSSNSVPKRVTAPASTSTYTLRQTPTQTTSTASRSYSGGSSYSAPSYSAPEKSQAEILAEERARLEAEERARQEAERERQRQAYTALVNAYSTKERDYSEFLKQQREAAQTAYNNGLSSLNNAYNTQLATLSSNLGQTQGRLLNSYNRSKSNINTDAENSLRQAYINHMLSQKNLGQQMSAMGLNGGATETTLANMLNNYGNSRNNIRTTLNNNLSNLENTYNDSLSEALQAYNNAVANSDLQRSQYAQQLESALADRNAQALNNYQDILRQYDNSYLNLLQSAIASGADISEGLERAQSMYNTGVANANAVQAQANAAYNQALANNQAQAAANVRNLSANNTAYLNALSEALANGSNVSYDPTAATNSVIASAVNQASNPTASTNYAAIQALLNGQNSTNNATVTAANPTVQNNNYLASILAQLRG